MQLSQKLIPESGAGKQNRQDIRSDILPVDLLAGEVGIEPTNAGIKIGRIENTSIPQSNQ